MNRYCELIQVTPLQEEAHATFDANKSDIKNANIRRNFSYEPRVASAAETVQGLRFAAMNSAN
jgi:hypothetical protein